MWCCEGAACPGASRKKLGIYIHVPFCGNGKCPYCDFYSMELTERLKEKYVESALRDIAAWSVRANDRTVDTIYFGGGTPSLLGEDLSRLLFCIADNFRVGADAEITFEANPGSIDYELLRILRESGFNRISFGMQSAIDGELEALGRQHKRKDVEIAVDNARSAGFDNISLDMMLCIPRQTLQSLDESIGFAASLAPRHISAYLLKIERGTRFFEKREMLNLPDDDTQADFYLKACETLKRYGFLQYEISNFAQKGFESKHNLKYWNCDEYLGFGPSAHSYFNGKRFHYRQSLDEYAVGKPPVEDGDGGSFEEYVMLRLRLSNGLWETELKRRFDTDFSCFNRYKLDALENSGLIKLKKGNISLTAKGFLVSNSVISELLFQ